MKRANVLVLAGGVLALAGLVALVVGRGAGDDGPPARVGVVVARDALSPGEAADDLVAAGRVAVEQRPVDDVPAGAVRTTDALAGQIVAATVAEGEALSGASLRPAVLRGAAIDIPDGLQAVAVTVPFTSGVAGYAGPGDRVNLYATVPPGAQGAPVSPLTGLLLTDVEVLDVSQEVAPRRAEAVTAAEEPGPAPAREGRSEVTLLLAVDAADAERVVFAASVNQLWFTLVPEGQGGSATDGVTYDQGYLEGGR